MKKSEFKKIYDKAVEVSGQREVDNLCLVYATTDMTPDEFIGHLKIKAGM